jgi:hypothetical protein
MTEEQNMSEPTTDELQHAFDDLVGDARPRADLAARARVRGTTLRRQRMAGGLTAVAVAGALCVPALTLVRDQAQGGGSAGASVAAQPKASDSVAKPPGTLKPQPSDKPKSSDAAGRGDWATATGVGPTEETVIKAGTLSALDNSRVEEMRSLLGSGFTLTASGIAVDKTTGAHIGAAATFTAKAGGGAVAVEWSIQPQTRLTEAQGLAGTTLTAKPGSDSGGAKGGGDQPVSGAVLVAGDTEWDAKIMQGSPGSTPILATHDDAQAFLKQLSSATS